MASTLNRAGQVRITRNGQTGRVDLNSYTPQYGDRVTAAGRPGPNWHVSNYDEHGKPVWEYDDTAVQLMDMILGAADVSYSPFNDSDIKRFTPQKGMDLQALHLQLLNIANDPNGFIQRATNNKLSDTWFMQAVEGPVRRQYVEKIQTIAKEYSGGAKGRQGGALSGAAKAAVGKAGAEAATSVAGLRYQHEMNKGQQFQQAMAALDAIGKAIDDRPYQQVGLQAALTHWQGKNNFNVSAGQIRTNAAIAAANAKLTSDRQKLEEAYANWTMNPPEDDSDDFLGTVLALGGGAVGAGLGLGLSGGNPMMGMAGFSAGSSIGGGLGSSIETGSAAPLMAGVGGSTNVVMGSLALDYMTEGGLFKKKTTAPGSGDSLPSLRAGSPL